MTKSLLHNAPSGFAGLSKDRDPGLNFSILNWYMAEAKRLLDGTRVVNYERYMLYIIIFISQDAKRISATNLSIILSIN
jgi:hypothetical protein